MMYTYICVRTYTTSCYMFLEFELRAERQKGTSCCHFMLACKADRQPLKVVAHVVTHGVTAAKAKCGRLSKVWTLV